MVTFDNSVTCEGNFFLSLSDSDVTAVDFYTPFFDSESRKKCTVKFFTIRKAASEFFYLNNMYQVANVAGGQISNVYIEPQGLIDHTHA